MSNTLNVFSISLQNFRWINHIHFNWIMEHSFVVPVFDILPELGRLILQGTSLIFLCTAIGSEYILKCFLPSFHIVKQSVISPSFRIVKQSAILRFTLFLQQNWAFQKAHCFSLTGFNLLRCDSVHTKWKNVL